jgi:hypothetical protein
MTQGAPTKDLIERLRAQDPTAVADLSDSYGAKIYQLAFRYLRNHEDAEEVAQDVLLKVYQKIDAFRGDVIVDLPHHVQRGDVATARVQAEPAERDGEDGR